MKSVRCKLASRFETKDEIKYSVFNRINDQVFEQITDHEWQVHYDIVEEIWFPTWNHVYEYEMRKS